MATTTFNMVIGARMAFQRVKSHADASFALSGGPLLRFTPYGSTSFSRSAQATGKAWLPPETVPWFDPKTGRPTREFARCMDYLMNTRMGGINGPSMTEVVTNVAESKQQAAQAVTQASAVEELAVANAEALKATVQVTQNSALDGAEQIPEVIVRTAYKRDTFL